MAQRAALTRDPRSPIPLELQVEPTELSGKQCAQTAEIEDEIEDLLDAVVNDVFAEVSYIQYVLVSLLNVTTRHLQGRRVHACAGFTG